MKKIKIFFIIPSLRSGGAERVVSFVAQNVDKTKFDSRLIVINSKNTATFEVNNVKVQFLNIAKVSRSFPSLMRLFYSEKPDIVFGTIGHINIMLGICKVIFSKIIFIGREVNVISKLKEVQHMKSVLPEKINTFFLHKLDMMVCQSTDMAYDFINVFKYPENKITIINNPVSEKFEIKQDKIKVQPYKLITVGSLVNRKGHLRILKVLKELKVPFSYTMVGNGDLKKDIFNTIEEYGLINNVKHIPFSNNVSELLEESDLFLLGSYVEGFPNVLLESCAVGTPVIAFNALGGINEIIIDHVNGYVVNNPNEYLEKIIFSLEKEWNINKVRDSVISRYNQEKIISDYEQLFLSLKNK